MKMDIKPCPFLKNPKNFWKKVGKREINNLKIIILFNYIENKIMNYYNYIIFINDKQ